jgi:hypothetical protein
MSLHLQQVENSKVSSDQYTYPHLGNSLIISSRHVATNMFSKNLHDPLYPGYTAVIKS